MSDYGSYLGSHNPLWPSGVVDDTYGSNGDSIHDSSTGVTWVKEAATSVWVPQTLDISKIVPSSGHLLYLDAAERTLDTEIGTLTDIFGSGDDPTNATGAEQPTDAPNGGPMALPSATFDGSDDNLAVTGMAGPGTNLIDVTVVAIPRSAWADGAEMFWFGDAGSSSYYELKQKISSNGWRLQHYEDPTTATVDTTDGATVDVPTMIRVYDDGTNIGIQVNGGTPSTNANAGSAGSKDQFRLTVSGALLGFDFLTLVAYKGSAPLSLGRRIAIIRAINHRYKTQRLFAEPSA